MSEVVEKRTIKGWLEELAGKNESSDEDSLSMQKYLRMIGFPQAVVVIGIVYPEGEGRPIDIHSMARMILESVNKKEE